MQCVQALTCPDGAERPDPSHWMNNPAGDMTISLTDPLTIGNSIASLVLISEGILCSLSALWLALGALAALSDLRWGECHATLY